MYIISKEYKLSLIADVVFDNQRCYDIICIFSLNDYGGDVRLHRGAGDWNYYLCFFPE